MTTIMNIEMKCAVCGETSSHPVVGSTNTMGYPDLDLRPAEMQRSTMHTWILECPHCGYAAPRLENETEITKEFVNTDSYITCDGYDFKSDLAKRFYRAYLIAKEIKDAEMKYYSIQYCAWACDDAEDKLAAEIRKLAVEAISELIETHPQNRDDLIIAKSDLMRRSRQFGEMIEKYEMILLGNQLLDRIIAFEIAKAKEEDDSPYTVEDVQG